MTYETWAARKRAEAFDTAIERLVNEGSDAEIDEFLRAENDVLRALHAHGLLP